MTVTDTVADMVDAAAMLATDVPTETPEPTFTVTAIPTQQPTIAPTQTQLAQTSPAASAIHTSTVAASATRMMTQTAAPLTTTVVAQIPTSARVPILMYHYISKPPDPRDQIRVGLSVPPDAFEQQMKFLRDNGYHTISLMDLYEHLRVGAPLPSKPLILTFDDGYRDNYEFAFPIMRKYGATGTIFLITDLIGKYEPYMTWQQVKEMSDAGMSMESHTRTHPDLRNVDYAHRVWQLTGPIEDITKYTGKRPYFFAYPAGRWNDDVLPILRDIQTKAAVTTQYGAVHTLSDALLWTRVRVPGQISLAEFAKIVN